MKAKSIILSAVALGMTASLAFGFGGDRGGMEMHGGGMPMGPAGMGKMGGMEGGMFLGRDMNLTADQKTKIQGFEQTFHTNMLTLKNKEQVLLDSLSSGSFDSATFSSEATANATSALSYKAQLLGNIFSVLTADQISKLKTHLSNDIAAKAAAASGSTSTTSGNLPATRRW